MHNVSQHSYRIIVAHVLEVHVIHLEGRGSGSETGWERPRPLPECPAQHTCKSMSPGSMRPSAATAPPFMMEPM